MEPEAIRFAESDAIPNSFLPLLLYRGALPADPAEIERAFATRDWRNSWRNGVYPFHHFHSIAHEVLGVAAGTATVLFGGPAGRQVELGPGDVVAIPAGVGHCRVAASPDFLIVGAYPGGADWDLRRGDPAELPEVRRNIAAVRLPATDPVYGKGGPLTKLWDLT
jgi:uncharacterized protein YjlB